MDVELGIIEGFYGKPWSWQDRAANVTFHARHGFRFYHFAPKADTFLRRRWLEPHPPADVEQLHRLAATCRANGVRFGIGLSPYEIFRGFDDTARSALAAKLAFFDEIGADDVAILFDDMRGDLPDLAERQAQIVEFAANRTSAGRLFVCPSYYSDDPVLDRVFGDRPPGYLERLGEVLDPAIHIYWTGEEVCSRAFSAGHLDRVAEQLRRKPFLWDNYPVNDGQRMSRFLHVRAFTGRPASIARHIAGHAVNPALQPTLTRVPAITLPMAYRQGDDYAYGEAQRQAAMTVLGTRLGEMLHEDVLLLQDVGLDQLGDKEALLRERYAAIDHPAAREIIGWLDGEWRITDEIVRTQ